MVRRTLEASYRDVLSTKVEVRAAALRDLMAYCRESAEERERGWRVIVPLLEDSYAAIRAEALSALAELEANDALPRMLTAIEDNDPYVRQMALRALGELGDSRAQRRLERALDDERPEVRYQATIAFARVCVDDEDKVRALAARIEDADPEVAHIALRVAEEWFDESSTAKPTLVEAASKRLGEPASPPASSALLAAAIFVTKVAVRCGGEPDPRALSILTAVAANRFASSLPEEDECEALELIGEARVREATPHLERRAFGLRRLLSASRAHSACVGLVLLGDSRAADRLRRALATDDPVLHERAVLAAARAKLPDAVPHLEEMVAREPESRALGAVLSRLRASVSSTGQSR